MLQASLKVIGGKNDGKLIEFKARKFLVGREQDCHLRPNSDLVSRHHCVFTLDDYALRLRDLGSTNGTLVNGRRVRGETVLTPGDVVRIGKLNFEVVIGPPEDHEASARPAVANQDTTTNASTLETSFDMPVPQTLEDSGVVSASPSGDTVFELEHNPGEETEAAGETAIVSRSESVSAESESSAPPGPETIEHPTPPPGWNPQQQPGQYPPEGMPGGWQYPQYPQYQQYPQYPQYPPQGYPMGYPPPGYPPMGYGYPQQPAPYPQNFPGQAPPPEEESDSSEDSGFPDIRLPNPEDTGIKEQPPKPVAPPPSGDNANAAPTQTPSQKAADLIKTRKRRTTDE